MIILHFLLEVRVGVGKVMGSAECARTSSSVWRARIHGDTQGRLYGSLCRLEANIFRGTTTACVG